MDILELWNVASRAAEAAAFFDCLIGQQDRHMGNCKWDAQHGLGLFDHGFTFKRPDDLIKNCELLDERVRRDHQALTTAEAAALGRLIASPNLLGLDAVLEQDRGTALLNRAQAIRANGALLSKSQLAHF